MFIKNQSINKFKGSVYPAQYYILKGCLIMNNDYQMEKLIVELKEFTEEKERLMLIASKMRDEYQDKINMYQDEILKKEQYTKDVIYSLIEVDKMKNNKTEQSYRLPSAKISIKKESKVMKLKPEYDCEEIPDKYLQTNVTVKWSEFKKTLIINGDDVVNKDTGEILKSVEVQTKIGGQLEIKL